MNPALLITWLRHTLRLRSKAMKPIVFHTLCWRSKEICVCFQGPLLHNHDHPSVRTKEPLQAAYRIIHKTIHQGQSILQSSIIGILDSLRNRFRDQQQRLGQWASPPPPPVFFGIAAEIQAPFAESTPFGYHGGGAAAPPQHRGLVCYTIDLLQPFWLKALLYIAYCIHAIAVQRLAETASRNISRLSPE